MEDHFSPLGLRDRVVIMSVFYEIAQVEQVEKAWNTWKKLQGKGSAESLWRLLARDPAVDREAIYEVAAQIYGFEEIEINRLRAQTLMRELMQTFTEKQWRRMFEMLVAPIAVGEDPRTGHARLIFATHDPTRPEVTRMLQEFKLNSFELRYAPPSKITELFTEIFGEEIKPFLFLQEGVPVDELEEYPNPVPEEPVEDNSFAELDASSLVDWFESVLVALWRARGTEARITVNDRRTLDVFFCVDDQVRLWRTEDNFHPEGVLVYVIDDVLRLDRFDPSTVLKGRIRRWIGKDLARFCITIHPRDDRNKLDDATVVVQVLGKG